MNKQETLRVLEMITLVATYYSKTLSPQVLEMYAEDLEDLDVEKVLLAYKVYRKDPKNRTFPLPAQIREIIAPVASPEARGRDIAARIQEAIPKFGWCNGGAARAFIGETGWEIVRSYGGWENLCQHHGCDIEPSVFYAQVRDRASDMSQYGLRDEFEMLEYQEHERLQNEGETNE